MDPGELLRRVRKRHEVKQSELARRVGTTQSAISRVEKGQRSPTVAYLEKLLNALDEDLKLDSAPARKRRSKKGSNILYRRR